jgi:hypothetical protein
VVPGCCCAAVPALAALAADESLTTCSAKIEVSWCQNKLEKATEKTPNSTAKFKLFDVLLHHSTLGGRNIGERNKAESSRALGYLISDDRG